MLKRQRQSSKMTNEQIQRKLMENGIYKDDLSRHSPLLCSRKRTSFSPVVTRKRENTIEKRTPSATQVVTTTTVTSTATISTVAKNQMKHTIDYDQPLDLRLQPNSISKF